MLTRDYIKKCALEAGFTLCGVARARVLTEHRVRYEAGLKASSEGYLEYLGRSEECRLDPSQLLKGARTIVVCALKYPFGNYSEPKVAAFAQIEEEYQVRVKRMLREVLGQLGDVRAKVCCDTSPILEKAWAVEAGLGWQGRNSLLINPRHGSFMSLGEIVLDAEVDSYDEPYRGAGCGSCRACVDACPVGAIGETADGIRTVSTAKCISSRTFEFARLNPGASVEPICGWISGCDECQLACPVNNILQIQKK